MNVKIKFIGTGSGKTSLNQFHSALLLALVDYNLLVDAGDGISRALLYNKINFNSINGIIITHLHPDHILGLPGLIIQMKMMKRKIPVDIYCHHSLKNVIENLLLNSYVIPERMKFEIQFKSFNDNESFNVSEKLTIRARKNSHLSRLEEYKDKYTSLNLYSASILFEIEDKKIVYTSDVNSVEDLLLFNSAIPDIYITDISHIEAELLFRTLNQIKAQKIYFTHFEVDDERKVSEILATFPDSIKSRVTFAHDGLSLEIGIK